MTKKNKIRLYIFLFLLVLSFVFSMKFIGYYNKEDVGFVGFWGRLLNKTNKFSVTYNNVNKNDFDILWQADDSSDTLVSKGEIINNFGYEYGPEEFIVLYKKVTLCSDGIWSTNNNDSYNVEININKITDGFVVTYLFKSDFESRKIEVRIDSNRNVIKNKILQRTCRNVRVI